FTGQTADTDLTTFIDSVSIRSVTNPNLFISDSINPANISALQLLSTGNINEIGAGAILLSGKATTVSAGGCITLGNNTNTFSNVSASGTDLTFNASSSIQFTGLTANGSLNVNTSSGAITQTSGMMVSGAASFATSGNITLANTSNNFTSVQAYGNIVTIQSGSNTSLSGNAPASSTVMAGTSVSMSPVTSGSSTPTVQWQVSTNNGTTWSNLAANTTSLNFNWS
ncbi:MAG: hypothetical protein ACKO5E_08000, partial [bacterium]